MAAKKPSPFEKLIEEGHVAAGTDDRFEIRKVSTGIPQLDTILQGGYAYGKNVMIIGPESVGKTVLAQYAVASVQADRPGSRALLIDAEMSFDRAWWEKSGVDCDRMWVQQPATGEIAVDTIIAALGDPAIGVIVLDSVAALSPTAIQEKAAGERTVASLSTLVANLYTKLLPKNRDKLFIAINQLRDNMNGYEDGFPGGRVLRHDSHQILRVRREGWIKDSGADGSVIGYMMEILARKNKLGSPMEECKVPFLYNSLIDVLFALVDQAIECGIIENRGPYYFWGTQRWLGKGAVRAHFREQQAEFEQLAEEVKGKTT